MNKSYNCHFLYKIITLLLVLVSGASLSFSQEKESPLMFYPYRNDLNFIDRLSFSLYCKVAISLENSKTDKCFINMQSIVDYSIKNNNVIKDLQNKSIDNYNLLSDLKQDISKIKLSYKNFNIPSYEYFSKSGNNQMPFFSAIVSDDTKTDNFKYSDGYDSVSAGDLVSLKKKDYADIPEIIKSGSDLKTFLGVLNYINGKNQLVLSGKAEVNVGAEYGLIRVGDYITLSPSLKGVGAKLNGAGYSFGLALSDDDGSGKVYMLIRPQYINR